MYDGLGGTGNLLASMVLSFNGFSASIPYSGTAKSMVLGGDDPTYDDFVFELVEA